MSTRIYIFYKCFIYVCQTINKNLQRKQLLFQILTNVYQSYLIQYRLEIIFEIHTHTQIDFNLVEKRNILQGEKVLFTASCKCVQISPRHWVNGVHSLFSGLIIRIYKIETMRFFCRCVHPSLIHQSSIHFIHNYFQWR